MIFCSLMEIVLKRFESFSERDLIMVIICLLEVFSVGLMEKELR